MYKNRPKWRIYFSIVCSLLILYSFYMAGLSLYIILILGIFFLLVILLRGPLYEKIDEIIVKKFPFVEKMPSWGKRLLIILSFFLVFAALKQIVFFSLKIAGIDLQEMMTESIYKSINIKEKKDERCSWTISRGDLEELGLHCSAIIGYYYGPAIVGMPSEKYECNPVPGCYFDPEIVPFRTLEECESACEGNSEN
jgi:hypothetical protein